MRLSENATLMLSKLEGGKAIREGDVSPDWSFEDAAVAGGELFAARYPVFVHMGSDRHLYLRLEADLKNRRLPMSEDSEALVKMLKERGAVMEGSLPEGWSRERVDDATNHVLLAGYQMTIGDTPNGVRYWYLAGPRHAPALPERIAAQRRR
jgi:hypothetical protein